MELIPYILVTLLLLIFCDKYTNISEYKPKLCKHGEQGHMHCYLNSFRQNMWFKQPKNLVFVTKCLFKCIIEFQQKKNRWFLKMYILNLLVHVNWIQNGKITCKRLYDWAIIIVVTIFLTMHNCITTLIFSIELNFFSERV